VVGPVAALTWAVGSTGAISAVMAERAATLTTTEVSVAARVSGPADRDTG